jgi:hypothetical protein
LAQLQKWPFHAKKQDRAGKVNADLDEEKSRE